MNFFLRLSRMVIEESDKKKLEQLGFHFQLFDYTSWPYSKDLKKARYVSTNSPLVCFKTLEDLKIFAEKIGEVIIRDDQILEIL